MIASEGQKEVVYCYTKDDPSSLVMLFHPDTILQKMLKPSQQTNFIWITPNPIPTPPNQSLPKIPHYPQISQSIPHLSNALNPPTIIICSPDLTQNVKQLVKMNQIWKIQGVIQFTAGVEGDLGEGCCQYGAEVYQGCFFMRVGSFGDLGQQIGLKRLRKCQEVQLENFLGVDSEEWKSNLLVRVLATIMNQKQHPQVRQQIITQLSTLTTKITSLETAYKNNKKQIQQFINQLKKSRLSTKKTIQWYTSTSKIYKLINDILRCGIHPAEIYYVQPFFRDLFKAVRDIYGGRVKGMGNWSGDEGGDGSGDESEGEVWSQGWSQGQGQGSGRFICYRGGVIYPKEIKEIKDNLGKMVENVCFISTSMNKKIAKQFAQNVLFEIIVDRNGNSSQNCAKNKFVSGYAEIKKLSSFQDEQQVLFNPFNFFKVLQITQKITYIKKIDKFESKINIRENKQGQEQAEVVEEIFYEIKLKYGQERMENKQSKRRELMGGEISEILYQSLWNQEKEYLTCQGHTLLLTNQNLSHSSAYWEKFLQISVKPEDILAGLHFLGMSEENKRDFEKAQELYTRALSISQQISEPFTPKTKKIFNSLQNLLQNLRSRKQISILSLQKLQNLCSQQIQSLFEYSVNNLTKSANPYCPNFPIQALQFFLNHPINIARRCNLADTYFLQMKYEDALRQYKICCRLYYQCFGERNLGFLRVVSKMMGVYLMIGDYQNAWKIQDRVGRFYLEVFGERSEDYINSVKNMGVLYQLQGNYSQSLQKYKKCSQLSLKSFGQTSSKYLQSICDIANIQIRQGHLKSALKTLQKYQNSPYNHRNGLILNKIAQIFTMQGKYLSALKYYQRCMELHCQKLGWQYYQYIQALNNSAIVHVKLKKYNEAVKLLQKISQIYLQFFSSQNSYYLNSLKYLSSVYYFLKKYNKSLQTYQKCHDPILELHGREHQEYLSYLFSIAVIYVQIDVGKALIMLGECLRVKLSIEDLLEEDYLYESIQLNEVINIHVIQGEYGKILQLLTPPKKPKKPLYKIKYIELLIKLTKIFIQMCQYESAQKYYRKSMKQLQKFSRVDKKLIKDLKNIGRNIMSNLGLRKRRREKAEDYITFCGMSLSACE